MEVNSLVTEPQAGPSNGGNKRCRSESSSSRTSSSSSSSSSTSDGKRKSRRHRKKKQKRLKRSSRKFEKLFKEMGELRKQISTNSNNPCDADSISIYTEEEMYDHLDSSYEKNTSQDVDIDSQHLTFEIETKLKEPSVPKTSDSFLQMLSDLQHFGSASWSEVRYADTQKVYNHTPGFIDLETNEEVKTYDTLRHLAHSDRSYAAITYGILRQKEALQEAVAGLLSWAQGTQLTPDSLRSKVDELFLKGGLCKISSDVLQLVCGHRAETIEMRRESITSQVKDPLVKVALNKIPPTVTHLFDQEKLISVLEKAGGVRKAFWPAKLNSSSQSRHNQYNQRPSRGQGSRKFVPSRGTQCNHNEGVPAPSQHTCYNNTYHNNLPSRGGYDSNDYPTRQVSNNFFHGNGRGSLRNKGSRPERQNSRGRGIANASRPPRGSNRFPRQ